MQSTSKALDGNGTHPWNHLLWDEGDLTIHAADTLSVEDLDFGGIPYSKEAAPDLEVSPEAQAVLTLVWCVDGQHWVTEIEDDICPACWQRMLDNIA